MKDAEKLFTWELKNELERRGFYVSDTIKGQDYYLKEEIIALRSLVREMGSLIVEARYFSYDGRINFNDAEKIFNRPEVKKIMEVPE